jgi:ATP-binding protein involved in chromosome partitioning
MADVIKAANMFLNESIQIPILGIVENMSYLMSRDDPPQKCYIFGKGGGKILADQYKVPLLGQIPISQNICESGEKGEPIAQAGFGLISIEFDKIASKVLQHSTSYHEHYY